VPAALSVNTVPRVELAGLKAAVTPLGSFATENVTLPVNPLAGTTVIVELPVAPCTMLELGGDAVNAKLGAAVTRTIKLVV